MKSENNSNEGLKDIKIQDFLKFSPFKQENSDKS